MYGECPVHLPTAGALSQVMGIEYAGVNPRGRFDDVLVERSVHALVSL
jgi:hypothetical protein